MATFDDLFGPRGGQKFLKWDNVGETLVMVVTEEPDAKYPVRNFATKKKVHLVQVNSGEKYKRMDEGDFDPNEVENSYPLTQIAMRVKVVGKKRADGSTVEDWEPFETLWEVNPMQEERLKETMMDERIPLVPGTIVGVKLLDKDSKPRKYSVKMKAAE